MRGSEPRDHSIFYGQTRWGKTTLLKRLLEHTPRWIALRDRKRDYTDDDPLFELGSETWHSFGELREAYEAAGRGELRGTLTSVDWADNFAALGFLWNAHQSRKLPPTQLVLDEAHHWADSTRSFRDPPFELPGISGRNVVKMVYAEGLGEGIRVATVAQFPQQLHGDQRRLSEVKVTVRLTSMLTEDIRSAFAGRLEEAQELDRLTPHKTPQEGIHFLHYPRELDLRKYWRQPWE